jgi:hypothetical protein
MHSHDDVGHCAPDTNGCGSQLREGHSFDERIIAVTAIDYRGRVLTVVSQADATCCSARAPEVMPFMTIMFGGPLGQMIWKGDTWADSLRNHETAVCKLTRGDFIRWLRLNESSSGPFQSASATP